MKQSLKNNFGKWIGKQVYIVAAKRTPIATFMGIFKSINAPLLASHAIKACLKYSGLKGNQID